jgi:hypothetical protein
MVNTIRGSKARILGETCVRRFDQAGNSFDTGSAALVEFTPIAAGKILPK